MYNQTHGSVFIYVPSIVPCMHAWCVRSWVLKNGHFWGYNFTSRSEVAFFPTKKWGKTAFFDTSLRLCRDFKKSQQLKDGEMVTWYVKIMFTSNNSIFKIKKKKKLIYYRGFGAFRIWENLPNIVRTLPFSETTNESGLLEIDGVRDAIMCELLVSGKARFRNENDLAIQCTSGRIITLSTQFHVCFKTRGTLVSNMFTLLSS